MRAIFIAVVTGNLLALFAHRAEAQHLWWNTEEVKDATCLYGEITVLATHDPIYYCGANWHPGEPAGGYCGIQHNGPKERRTIFSIWDTSPTLHPKVSEADPKTIFNRFGGEGEGAHTHMLWDWKAGDTFQFFARKEPGMTADTIVARYYLFDRGTKKWRQSATISCPSGDQKSRASVATFSGGGLASFLENFGGRDKDVPKLALYRLWIGTDVKEMKCLTKAEGDGTWGQLHDAYFLAEGESGALEKLYGKLRKEYGEATLGEKGKKLKPISDRPLADELIKALQSLPKAAAVKDR